MFCILQDCVSVLLSSAAGVQDSGDGEGRTALMWAAQRGNYAVLNTLLQAGSDSNAVDHFGSTGKRGSSCVYKTQCGLYPVAVFNYSVVYILPSRMAVMIPVGIYCQYSPFLGSALVPPLNGLWA